MNKRIWNLYKSSQRGKEVIDLFTYKGDQNIVDWAENIFKKHLKYFGAESIDSYGGESVLSYCVSNFILAFGSIQIDEKPILVDDDSGAEYFKKLIEVLEVSQVEVSDNDELFRRDDRFIICEKGDYKGLCSIVSELSLVLFNLYPDYFIPILFREDFDVFMKILDVLEIPIPELPAKYNKKDRLLLYATLNDALIKFTEENGFTTEETCACIYDFALMMLDEDNSSDPLPPPTNVWLTGGSKGDYKAFLENPVKGEKSVWTCNENTKRGDIIIMYVLSPYSCIQSIWRADIDGVFTPFNYYNSRTKATEGILIPHITIKELKTDPYFSKLPITRKNFQGVNGIRFTSNDYFELQKLLAAKGFDTSILPQLYSPKLKIERNLKVEKDIEEMLLIPLLEKLGFTEADWSRQISQKAGRKEKAIPDFVFLPKGEKHFQNAPMIIEAKFNMNSNLEQMKAYNQALSYARMMKSKILGICDKDRLIIYKEKDGFFDRFKPTFENYWDNLNDQEIFRELKLLVGREVFED